MDSGGAKVWVGRKYENQISMLISTCPCWFSLSGKELQFLRFCYGNDFCSGLSISFEKCVWLLQAWLLSNILPLLSSGNLLPTLQGDDSETIHFPLVPFGFTYSPNHLTVLGKSCYCVFLVLGYRTYSWWARTHVASSIGQSYPVLIIFAMKTLQRFPSLPPGPLPQQQNTRATLEVQLQPCPLPLLQAPAFLVFFLMKSEVTRTPLQIIKVTNLFHLRSSFLFCVLR